MQQDIRLSTPWVVCATLLFFISAFFGFAHTTTAQIASLGGGGLNLVLEPEFPTPHTPVTISIDDYSIDAVGATIHWYIDDTERTEFVNNRSITLIAGALGETTNVRAVLSRTSSLPHSKTVNVTPVNVDVILESDTYTPSFYHGRALPSGNALVHAVAIVLNGSKTAPGAYAYRWTLNNEVLFGGAVKGKYRADFQMPRYSNGNLLVEIFNEEGIAVGERLIPLTLSEPELHFYEYSPLRGLSGRALNDSIPLIGSELTVYGEPYFMNTRLQERDATFTWQVDGVVVAHDQTTPNAITLTRQGSGAGQTSVDLRIVTKSTIPQFVEKAVQLLFN